MPKMPPRDKKLLEKLKGAWKDGLSDSAKDPEKYTYEARKRMDKTKPFKGFKSKKTADEVAERVVERFVASED